MTLRWNRPHKVTVLSWQNISNISALSFSVAGSLDRNLALSFFKTGLSLVHSAVVCNLECQFHCQKMHCIRPSASRPICISKPNTRRAPSFCGSASHGAGRISSHATSPRGLSTLSLKIGGHMVCNTFGQLPSTKCAPSPSWMECPPPYFEFSSAISSPTITFRECFAAR